ncbi:unnamed protein product [Discula destructiva]
MPTVTVPNLNTSRARSYVFRLPLFTRIVIAAILAAWVVQVAVPGWDLRAWGALVPAEVGLSSLYRTNTYPFIHLGFFHMVMNVLALTPLLERFESEYGTLTALALFMGPFSTLPAFLYVLMQTFLLHHPTAGVSGASVWVFLLLAVEAMRTHRTNPYFAIGPCNIPTWTTPLITAAVLSALAPASAQVSLLGHVCALAVGYVCGLGYMKWLSPPEKALRWVEGRLNLLQRLPRYVSVDAKTYGRFGVLPSAAGGPGVPGVELGVVGSTQRLGP